ncbi:fumarylacetoacetate hydrolase [Auriculariales sp. MPI-PUGE-AT-0066]|nr:fumarylacetoacetate hydrolase [Auriculariales sp. MPI-PUGE-AT-0066]
MWQRLIRFVAAEDGRIHYGQPCDPHVDVGVATASPGSKLAAFDIIGDVLSPSCRVTKRKLTVKRLLTPLSREQVGLARMLGLNYRKHAAEANMTEPKYPVLFYKPVTALIGAGDTITIPKVCQPVEHHLPDFEVELTIVIGKPCKNVSEEEALDYVLGYSLGNDVSFRYHQLAVSQWSFSKGFDDATPWGPCIVNSSLIPDPQVLKVKSVVNGEVLQDSTTADQIFSVRKTIAFLSQGTTLLPGSIIMTGTPEGVGFVRKPPIFLKNGDKIEQHISGGIGTLLNTVVEEGKEKAKL